MKFLRLHAQHGYGWSGWASIRDEMAQATACKLSGIGSIRFSIIRGLENLLKYHP